MREKGDSGRGGDPILASRRRVVAAVLAAAFLGFLHHADHVLRGDAGWPFGADVDGFTYSLLVYPIVAVELYLLAKGRLLRRYRMAVAVAAFAFVALTHFGPMAADPLSKVYSAYAWPVAGATAAAVLVGLLVSLVALFLVSFAAGRPGGTRQAGAG